MYGASRIAPRDRRMGWSANLERTALQHLQANCFSRCSPRPAPVINEHGHVGPDPPSRVEMTTIDACAIRGLVYAGRLSDLNGSSHGHIGMCKRVEAETGDDASA